MNKLVSKQCKNTKHLYIFIDLGNNMPIIEDKEELYFNDDNKILFSVIDSYILFFNIILYLDSF